MQKKVRNLRSKDLEFAPYSYVYTHETIKIPMGVKQIHFHTMKRKFKGNEYICSIKFKRFEGEEADQHV